MHSEARKHVSSLLLSMCLSVHVATYIPTRARENSGAVIPNHTWLRDYLVELCQEFEPVNSTILTFCRVSLFPHTL